MYTNYYLVNLLDFFVFRIQLEPCQSEIDITIVDRISAVLNPLPICTYNLSSITKETSVRCLFHSHLYCIIMNMTKKNLNIYYIKLNLLSIESTDIILSSCRKSFASKFQD